MTPGENYREAQLLADRAAAADGAGRLGERDYLIKLAAVHAALAQCPPETYTEADAVHRGEPAPEREQPVGGIADLTHRIDQALAVLAGPAWPAVDCGPSAAWSDLADLVVSALTGPYYQHWRDEHPDWPGGERSAPGAGDVILVSAEDLRAVVAAVQANRYGAQEPAALDAAGRLAARIEGS